MGRFYYNNSISLLDRALFRFSLEKVAFEQRQQEVKELAVNLGAKSLNEVKKQSLKGSKQWSDMI